MLALVQPTLAATSSPFAGYSGQWRGGGSVRVHQFPVPLNVSCSVEGSSSGKRSFSLDGTCRAMVFMSRKIRADLTLDPRTGVYRGVYIGSSTGPAKLAGRMRGDTLDLQVTWAKVIYDDNKARMVIRNPNGRNFSMQVIEKINGKRTMISNLAFHR
ncbi:hypothetical protein [Jiella sp. M17.18]|uniref:hypothetical protein n=1 Tax=Jiella sp. M17.18 TaxID=3234247 RepID=UPI0034DE371F